MQISLVNYYIIIVGMRNFQNTFETRNRSFAGALSSCMSVPLRETDACNFADDQLCAFVVQT